MSTLSWILQIIFIAGVIYGIRLLNSPETAVKGNFINAASMAGAIIVTMVEAKVLTMPVIWAGLIVGSALGVWMSVKVLMIQMPQMVALLNGLGGGASATVALLTVYMAAHIGLVPFTWFTSGLAIIVGGVTLSGSLVAAAKLHGKMNQRPVHLPYHNLQLFASLAVMALSTLGLTFSVGHPMLHAVIITVLSLYFGYVFTVRVGGADMPITISLLNSFSGVAGAIAGFALENGALLIVVGSIVGASGLILTQLMCRAMNTSLMNILTGKTTAATKKKSSETPKAAPQPEPKPEPKAEQPAAPHWEAALRSAKKVVIIPGYGMALAQAQLQVKQLGDLLAGQGKEVRFGIHPVAGRMPGHMNVLLAEVDVPYDQLYELDDINAFLEDADVAIIVGANDVVNPAAIELEGTPIYGMPIIRADHARQVLVCNYDTKPGYAGVDNSLYEMDKVELLLGDAKDSIAKLMAVLKGEKTSEPAAEEPKEDLAGKLRSAKKVVIIPGYGMALAQAQGQVKQFGELLQSQGKEVRYGIHPVAGRMPGHMNVLLAEVDVPYDQLYELDEINAFIEEADLAVIVGANDVVNPAAIELEGTPIYGMPIIRADRAKHVIICNYDTKPGYAGVDNSLYEMDRVQMLLGDAKDSLAQLIAAAKGEASAEAAAGNAEADPKSADADPVALLQAAKRVVIVPGYGMALAQAQGQVKRLVEHLEARGVRVEIAVHPVAGRMPGHMNVLMAGVDIPYELMLEMDQINDQFKEVDVAVVVGANDVINPAANTHEGTPIYGMPILNVEHARHVVIYNLDRSPGYAGVENTLYDAPNCIFVAGDAAQTLAGLVDALKASA